MADKQIQCGRCGREFTFTAGEQNHYQERDLQEPKRCKNCREARKSERDAGDGDSVKSRGHLMKQAAREMDALFKPAKKGSKKAKKGSNQ